MARYLLIFLTFKTAHSTGTKNVVKAIKKIAEGKVKDEGKVWFQQLRDKRERIYINLLTNTFEKSICHVY